MSGGRVLVCGLACVDVVHLVDALPEGGNKHRSHGLRQIGGGCAANAAVAVARLGGEALLLTRIGDDAAGRWLAEALAAQGVTLLSPPAAGGQTPQSAVMVDAAGERMIVNFRGAGLPEDVPGLPGFDASLADTRWNVGACAALGAARARGVPGVLDGEAPVGPEAALASHAVFSAPGLRAYAGRDDLDAALAACDLPGRVAYTDGAAGVVWRDGPRLAPLPVAVVDTLGAGDVWHGAFALALARGEGLDAASRFANHAAATKCGRAGGWEVYPTARDLASREAP